MPITFLTATEKIKKSRKKEKQLVTNVDVLFLCSNLVTQENKKKKKKVARRRGDNTSICTVSSLFVLTLFLCHRPINCITKSCAAVRVQDLFSYFLL